MGSGGCLSKYADEARNIIEAEVWSVVELTSKDRRDIKQKLTRLTGKKNTFAQSY